jgi:DNA-binding IscR family transcriptional regulator
MKTSEIDDHMDELNSLAMIAMNGLLSNRALVTSFPGKFEGYQVAKSAYSIAKYMLIEKKSAEEQLTLLAEDE